MRRDPLRVAGWCVVVMAALVFAAAVRRISQAPQPLPQDTRGPAQPAVSPPPPVPTAPPPAPSVGAYAGNTKTHKFHRMTCRYATCKNCTVRFATRDEAIAAGFHPGGCCDP